MSSCQQANELHTLHIYPSSYACENGALQILFLVDENSGFIEGSIFVPTENTPVSYDEFARFLFVAWGMVTVPPGRFKPPKRLMINSNEIPALFAWKLSSELRSLEIYTEISFSIEAHEDVHRLWRFFSARLKKMFNERFPGETVVTLAQLNLMMIEEVHAYNGRRESMLKEEKEP